MLMAARRKILVLVDWYLPGYKAGGPIRSVANIVNSLSGEFDFSIVTRNTDYLETEPYRGIESDKWVHLDNNVRAWYFSEGKLNRRNLQHLLSSEEYDTVYLNSFFSLYFSLIPLYILRYRIKKQARIILAPRGMLAANALNIKRGKKKLFLLFAKMFGLHEGITWHASSFLEAAEIKGVFPLADVKVALNLPSPGKTELKKRIKRKGEVKLFFLSRIAVKKNLLAAIGAVSKVSEDTNVELDIYGPVDEHDYWEQCKRLIDQIPSHVAIRYKGALENAKVQEALLQYHFMLFPTLNENYGHVILESLSAGCPVIISDQTPWRGLEKEKAGWDLPLKDTGAFVKVIERCAGMDQQEYNEWSTAAFHYASGFLSNELTLQQNRDLFK
jgi:glycosyltransferase involved in cell wall biosynthesis